VAKILVRDDELELNSPPSITISIDPLI